MAILLYSAFAEEQLTVFYFFIFQEINDEPRKMQKPVKDFRVIGHAAQSASQKAQSLKSGWAGKNKPRAGHPFK